MPVDAVVTANNRSTPARKSSKPTKAQLREELFAKGSEFKRTKRAEIVGIDNVLGEIDEIIHWLRNAKAYTAYKSRLQPGVIFEGVAGSGKTLVSRWIATESEALFINVREFAHDGALFSDDDIRDLFKRARKAYKRTGRPVLLFWDEFENCALERGEASTTPEQHSVVSQLTAELDGIHGKNEGILLVGCTNYISSIDQALTRRGRMGLVIEFHAPDRAGKEKILRHYLATMSCEKGIDINTLSYFFPKYNTAADIEEACVEAWRNAVYRSIETGVEPHLSSKDLVRVFIKQLVGPPTTFVLQESERRPIAIHECGHAIAALVFGIPIRLITVQPGKKTLGRVMVDDRDEHIGSIEESVRHMYVGFGGVAAERAARIPEGLGAESDLKRLNEQASFLVDGLTLGTRTRLFSVTNIGRQIGYSNLVPQISAQSITDSDCDVRELLDKVETTVVATMEAIGESRLAEIARVVDERVTMTGKEFRELFVTVCGAEPEAFDHSGG